MSEWQDGPLTMSCSVLCTLGFLPESRAVTSRRSQALGSSFSSVLFSTGVSFAVLFVFYFPPASLPGSLSAVYRGIFVILQIDFLQIRVKSCNKLLNTDNLQDISLLRGNFEL